MSKQSVTFTVEKDIPVATTRTSKYHVPKMEVGDSIGVAKNMKSAHGAIKKELKLRGEKSTSRIQPDGSLRIWRIA
jgi:hypothetical protein